MPEKTIQVHDAVILSGSPDRLAEIKQVLEQNSFRCHHYRDHAMLVHDVAVSELPELTRVATHYNAVVEQIRGLRGVRIAADEEETKQAKQPDLSVMAGGWYKTNQDAFPLLHVIEVRNQVDTAGLELWLFDVDLVAGDALPMQATIDAAQLQKYKPKPATLDDFYDLDITPPADFESSPHVLPSVEDTPDNTTTAGVSLPKAQIAALALQRQLGPQNVRAEAAPVPTGGFVVKAQVFGQAGNDSLPEWVNGTPVRYYK